jgi:hypothetical protein
MVQSYIVKRTPAVEQAWIFDIHPKFFPDPFVNPWSRLTSLYLGQANSRIWTGSLPVLRPTLRDLCVENFLVDLFAVGDPPSKLDFPQLQRLSIRNDFPFPSGESVFETLLRPCIASGSLRELEIWNFPFGFVHRARRDKDWFRSDGLVHLGVRGTAQHSHTGDPDQHLMDLADRFPNLRSLDVGNEPVQDTTLARLVERGVKTIYHACGSLKQDFKEWARTKHGADVVDGDYPHSPTQLPDSHTLKAKIQRGQRVPVYIPSTFDW